MRSEQESWAKDAPQLRLFCGEAEIADGDARGLSPQMGLWQFYLNYARPVVLEPKSKPRGLDVYDQVMGRWRDLTGDPPLASIDEYTLSEFIARVKSLTTRAGRPLANNTIHKHWVHVDRILKLTGPRSRQQKAGKGLLEEVPFIEGPRKEEKPVIDPYSIAEIESLLMVCQRATVPRSVRGIGAPTFWRALVLFIYNVGTRIETTLQIEWEMIHENWLALPAAIMKGHAGKRPWLNGHAMEAIEPLRAAGHGRIFPWPHTSWYIQEVRRRLLARTLIPLRRRRDLGFHGLRRAMTAMIAPESAPVAQDQLGHTEWATTKGSYIPKEVRAQVMERLPQPDASRVDPQMRMW